MAWAQYQISRVLLQVGAVEICDTQHLGGRVSEGREMELSSSERRSLHSTWGPPFGSHGGKESWLSFGAGAPFFSLCSGMPSELCSSALSPSASGPG